MLVEDRRQRARADERTLVTLGVVERKYDPTQPRDPGGENGGQWTKSPTAAVKYTVDEFEKLYSAIVDEADGGDMVVSVHENGDFVLSVLGGDQRTVLFDGLNPVSARSIADGLDWAASENIPDDAEEDPDTHLVDWEYVEEDIIVGYYVSGDVSLRVPRSDNADPNNLDDFDIKEMDEGTATDLGEALRDMADRYEELDENRSHTPRRVARKWRRRRARADHYALRNRRVGVAHPPPDPDEDDDEDLGPLDPGSLALLTAIVELLDKWLDRAFNPAKHARIPKGQPGAGRFRSMVDRLKDAIEGHVKGGKDGHPFEEFDREQLRRVAKARGIALKRGEDRDSIARKLLDHLGVGGNSGGSNAMASPPKKPSTNPVEVTGRNSRWWTVLNEDTGLADPVPIRNLELNGGYLLKSGKAYRIDGITYLVEDGTTQTPDRIVEGFRYVHRGLPPEADQYQQGYAWLAGRNPADAYWEKKYKIADFESLATAGDGAVRIWGRAGALSGPMAHRESLMHEFGHNVSHAVEDRDLHDHSARWTGAARADAGVRRPTDVAFSGPMAFRLRSVNFQHRTDRPYPNGVSEYGTSSPAEDYAESMAFYLADEIGTGRLAPGDDEVPIYFRDLFPARAKIFDQVFPEIAKRQKAAVSAR